MEFSKKEKYFPLAESVMEIIKNAVPQSDPVEIVLSSGEQLETEVRNGDVESLENSRSSSLSVSFAVDQRRAGFSTNDLSRETVERMVKDTVSTIPFIDQDPFYQLPERDLLGKANVNLDDEDEAFDRLEMNDLIEDIRKLEKNGLSLDEIFISNGAYSSISKYSRIYLSSAGFSAGKSRTMFRKGLGLVAADGSSSGINSGRRQSSGYYTIATHLEDLESNETIAKEAARRTKRKLGAKKPETQNVPVIFTPDTARSILGAIESALSGHSLYREASFLLNKKDKMIASKNINLLDNPLLPRGLGSALYDNEGAMAKEIRIIHNGRLLNYLLDSYSASKLKMKNNGRKGGATNFILTPGNISEEELISTIDNGLYLTELSGQGVNIITGEFSRGGQGLWIKNGQIAYPVSEFTINGNLKDMLMNIVAVANNTDHRSSYLSPSIAIGEMSIAGI